MPPPYGIKGFGRFRNLKKKAFTLAETLITLTIIGVVAALTIPTLMTKYQNQTFVTGLKKFHSELQIATKMIPISLGCSDGDWECAKAEAHSRYNPTQEDDSYYAELIALMYALADQFKTQQVCTGSDSEGCDWLNNEKYKRIWYDIDPTKLIGITKADGMRIFCPQLSSTCGVDINGAKGPNLIGRDIFVFSVADSTNLFSNLPGGTVVMRGSKLDPESTMRCTTKAVKEQLFNNDTDNADTCAGRVLEEDAMNY